MTDKKSIEIKGKNNLDKLLKNNQKGLIVLFNRWRSI